MADIATMSGGELDRAGPKSAAARHSTTMPGDGLDGAGAAVEKKFNHKCYILGSPRITRDRVQKCTVWMAASYGVHGIPRSTPRSASR